MSNVAVTGAGLVNASRPNFSFGALAGREIEVAPLTAPWVIRRCWSTTYSAERLLLEVDSTPVEAKETSAAGWT